MALLPVAIAWLASAVTIVVVGRHVSAYALDIKVEQFLSSYFLITLDEPMFSDATGIVNDRESIANVGKTLNAAIESMIERSWFAGAGSCRAVVQPVVVVSRLRSRIACRVGVCERRCNLQTLQNAVHGKVIDHQAPNFLPSWGQEDKLVDVCFAFVDPRSVLKLGADHPRLRGD
jgi:hypothetical protein